MKSNLYNKIKSLVDRKFELKNITSYIKHDKTKQAEFDKCVLEYYRIDETLSHLSGKHFISSLKVAEILSKKEHTPYVLKIFRETTSIDGEKFYTGNFVVCYLNGNNKYFNYDTNGVCFNSPTDLQTEKYINYSLPRDEFNQLLASLQETNSYVLATSKEQSFVPALAPSNYLERINFINLFIHGRVSDFVSSNFQQSIKNDIKQYLESIEVDEFVTKNDNQDEMIK